MTRSQRIAAGAVVMALLAGLASGATAQAPSIPFAPIEDTSLKDPDNPLKKFRVDFARVENEFPLSRADLMKITPEALLSLSQEQIDQIYGRLTAGPIPDGTYRGDLFFARGDTLTPDGETLRTRLDEIFGGIKGRLAEEKIEFLETLGRGLWKGKVFEKKNGVLRNMIADLVVLRLVVDDPSKVPSTRIPRGGFLGKYFGWVLPDNEVWLLFPAKVYCGQSLLDARRESIIVDYNYSDEIADYRASPDSLAGRGGLKIRDEIRMIRPGFYLGRAYTNRMFLLNFTLYNADIDKAGAADFTKGSAIAEDCWPGEQARKQ